MKQEKKPTVWCDLESRLEPWQEQAWGQISGGLKKGEMFIISSGRGTGKSQLSAMYMAGSTFFGDGTAVFGSPWEEWQNVFVWPWNRKTSIESGKKIWGHIKVRYSKIVLTKVGRDRQYATNKEVFQRKLKGID